MGKYQDLQDWALAYSDHMNKMPREVSMLESEATNRYLSDLCFDFVRGKPNAREAFNTLVQKQAWEWVSEALLCCVRHKPTPARHLAREDLARVLQAKDPRLREIAIRVAHLVFQDT